MHKAIINEAADREIACFARLKPRFPNR